MSGLIAKRYWATAPTAIALGVASLTGNAASAGYTAYFDNNAQFKADLGTPVEVEDFESPVGFVATEGSPVVFTKTGTELSFTDTDAGNFVASSTSSSIMATSGVQSVMFTGDDEITFTFAQAVKGFAIDISALQDVATPSTFVAAFGAQIVPIRFAATNLSPDTFNFGVISDTAFNSVTFFFGTGGSGDAVLLDTLELAPVPEPATLALITLGLAATLTGRRHRG